MPTAPFKVRIKDVEALRAAVDLCEEAFSGHSLGRGLCFTLRFTLMSWYISPPLRDAVLRDMRLDLGERSWKVSYSRVLGPPWTSAGYANRRRLLRRALSAYRQALREAERAAKTKAKRAKTKTTKTKKAKGKKA